MILSVDNIHESCKAKVKQKEGLTLILIGMICLPIQTESQRPAAFFKVF